MTTTQATTNTPGFNIRLTIRFSVDSAGRKVATYWSRKAGRTIRVSAANAELWIAQDLADRA